LKKTGVCGRKQGYIFDKIRFFPDIIMFSRKIQVAHWQFLGYYYKR